jgi:hypothetical protein
MKLVGDGFQQYNLLATYFRGATGMARAPKPGKTLIMAAAAAAFYFSKSR